MAGAGKKTFQVNEVLSAADVNQYLMDQSVMRFADSTARSSAIGTPSEGMVSYLDDTDQVEVFDGSQWVNFTGDITQVTAGTALTGGGTEGNVTLDVDISALATAQAGTALTASGETLNVDETELFTGGTAGYTALSNGTAGLSYQPVSHNYIINGAFDINQRGGTAVSANDSFLFDRWNLAISGATLTASTETFTSGDIEAIGFGDAKNYVSVETAGGTGSTQNTQIRTRIEDVRTLANQQATLSFWAKADSGTPKVALEVTQVFDGSSVVRNYGGNVTISTSWARYSLTFTVPSVSGKTIGASSFLQMTIWTSAGSAFDSRTGSIGIQNNTISFWGVQLEAGSIATPFKRNAPSLQGELAACQRYYQEIKADKDNFQVFVSGGYATTTSFRSAFVLPTTMRTTPTFSSTGSFATAGNGVLSASSVSVARLNESIIDLTATVSGATVGAAAVLRSNNDATTSIQFSAEL